MQNHEVKLYNNKGSLGCMRRLCKNCAQKPFYQTINTY